jgi:hypothetical protein
MSPQERLQRLELVQKAEAHLQEMYLREVQLAQVRFLQQYLRVKKQVELTQMAVAVSLKLLYHRPKKR